MLKSLISGVQRLLKTEEKKLKRFNEGILSKHGISDMHYIFYKNYEISPSGFGINYSDVPFKIGKWMISNNQLVMKDELIIDYQLNNNEEIFIKTVREAVENSGRLIHLREQGETINDGEVLYAIHPEEVNKAAINKRIQDSFVVNSYLSYNNGNRRVVNLDFSSGASNQLILKRDDFDGTIAETIPYTLSSNFSSSDFKLIFLKNRNNLFRLKLIGYRKIFRMKKSDEFVILTESQNRINFRFLNEPREVSRDSDGIIIENDIALTKEIINQLVDDSLINWKLISDSKTLKGNTLNENKTIELHKTMKYSLKGLMYLNIEEYKSK